MAKPNYIVTRFDEGRVLTRNQLGDVLNKIPLDIGVLTGHDLTIGARAPSSLKKVSSKKF